MEFSLTEEQRAIRDLARTFARDELIPGCAEFDRLPDGEDAFPEIVKPEEEFDFFGADDFVCGHHGRFALGT